MDTHTHTHTSQSDLCSYHSVHVLIRSKSPSSSVESVPHLQPLILQFLHDVITTLNPALGHSLINSLMVPNGGSSYLANNEALQMIYIDCINETLDCLSQAKGAETTENDSSYDSQYDSDHSSNKTKHGLFKECEKKVSFVYTILSLVDPANEMSRVNNRLDRIFHTLLRTTFKIGADLSVRFDSGRVYACLLGRSSPLLINRFHEVEEYLRMNRRLEHEEDSSTSLEDTPLHKEREPSLLEFEWKERFYQALYDHKHLLENVIDNGLQLIFTGKLSELSEEMSQLEYVPLRPLLLLLGWDRYNAVGSRRELLDSLRPKEVRNYFYSKEKDYSETSDSGPSKIGTVYNIPLYKGHCLRSQMFTLPILSIHLQPPRRGQPLQRTKHVNLYCPQRVPCSEVPLYIVYSYLFGLDNNRQYLEESLLNQQLDNHR